MGDKAIRAIIIIIIIRIRIIIIIQLVATTNEMQPSKGIYYSTVHH